MFFLFFTCYFMLSIALLWVLTLHRGLLSMIYVLVKTKQNKKGISISLILRNLEIHELWWLVEGWSHVGCIMEYYVPMAKGYCCAIIRYINIAMPFQYKVVNSSFVERKYVVICYSLRNASIIHWTTDFHACVCNIRGTVWI